MSKNSIGTVLLNVVTKWVTREGSEELAIKYRNVVRELKEAKLGHIPFPGILPVMGNKCLKTLGT